MKLITITASLTDLSHQMPTQMVLAANVMCVACLNGDADQARLLIHCAYVQRDKDDDIPYSAPCLYYQVEPSNPVLLRDLRDWI